MMHRRRLLTLVPAVAALGIARQSQAKPIVAASLVPAGFAISVQAYSFKNFTAFQAVERAAAAGVDAIEFYPGQKLGADESDTKLDANLSDALIAKLLEHCAKNKITIANFGVVPISKNEADARKVFEFGKKLGVYGLTTESVDALDTIEKLAKEYDVKVCIHNHRTKENYIPGDPYKLLELLKDRDPRIGFCADVGHWATSGLDPNEVIKKVAPRVLAFHMKDRTSVEKETIDVPFGRGILRIGDILAEVRKHGFAGNVSIEYEANWDNSVPDVAQCVGYLRAYGKLRAS